ncbi:uncharacterized protein LTR77_002636 [Saxophila tyrrhenica]|uniref:Uncharacterized protein n=1 Tax=Saxophila tyrrhenica TaxID=1690608 RepID=A0AAV9PFY7_9PEZI|nr:hypothetical protein LTR77_002636 [Saxophila tyrrhenica]
MAFNANTLSSISMPPTTPTAQPSTSTATTPTIVPQSPTTSPTPQTLPANSVKPRRSPPAPQQQHTIPIEEPLAQVLLTWFVQVIGLAAAIVFAVFAVLSWIDSQHAKAQANAANLLALAAICTQTLENTALKGLCDPFFTSAWPSIAAAVQTLLPYVPSSAAPSYSHVPDGSQGADTGAGLPHLPPATTGQKVGIGVGLGIGVTTLFVTGLTYFRIRGGGITAVLEPARGMIVRSGEVMTGPCSKK